MMKPRPLSLAMGLGALLCLAALCLAPGPVWAGPDDEPDPNDISAKIKKQMEKIIELMERNENALLKLSTGAAAKTEKVDVEVPVPPEGKGEAGSDPSAKGSSGKSDGAEIRRKLDEMLGQRKKASAGIPQELEELVRMIPT